jgi:hypothetical protein
MIIVIDAKLRNGYSSMDHYITGHECDDMIGRKFASVKEAGKAAFKCTIKNAAHSSLKGIPVRLTVAFANGTIREIST